MLAWIMILTVVGLDGTTTHIDAKFTTVKQCVKAGNNLSTVIADRVGSTGFICTRKSK